MTLFSLESMLKYYFQNLFTQCKTFFYREINDEIVKLIANGEISPVTYKPYTDKYSLPNNRLLNHRHCHI